MVSGIELASELKPRRRNAFGAEQHRPKFNAGLQSEAKARRP
jgi:hypothetical protein